MICVLFCAYRLQCEDYAKTYLKTAIGLVASVLVGLLKSITHYVFQGFVLCQHYWLRQGLFQRVVMHKMRSDDRKCVVVKCGFCNAELRRNEKLVRRRKVERAV